MIGCANIEAEGELFIRLAFTDNDGKTTYSPLKKVKCQEPEITLSPNPAHQQTVIRLANQRDAFAAVQVFDMAGKMVLEQVFSATSATQIYTLQTGQLPAGTYLVQTTLQTGRNMGNLLVVGK